MRIINRTCWLFLGGVVLRLALAGGVASAQDAGVRFEQGLTWEAVQAKAKREHKFMFLVWHAAECNACDKMTLEVYPQAQVGQFFNAKFISVRVETDAARPEGEPEVAGWAAEVRSLRQQYQLTTLPAFLFLAPDGQVMHKAVGGKDAAGLLATAVDAVTPQRQYYPLLAQYRRGRLDLAVQPYLVRTARSGGDYELATTIAKDYISRAPERELLTRDNIALLTESTARSTDPGFAVFRRHADQINQVLGMDGYAQARIDAIITEEDVTPLLRYTDPLPDWDAMTRAITRKYSAAEAVRIVTAAEQQRSNELQLLQAAKVNVTAVNNIAWFGVFLRSHDPEELRAAIGWMERLLRQEGDTILERFRYNFIDTYANLLYKAGRVDEAITWEEKALATAPAGAFRESLRETLEMMIRGEPTWPKP